MGLRNDMSKYSPKKITYQELEKLWGQFVRVLVALRTEDNVKRFLKDLMNRQERLMFVRRLLIAKYLADGWSYEQIQKKLGVGRTTIARVQRWLEFGREGYKRAIKRLRV